MATEIAIIAAAIVAVILLALLIYVAIWRTRNLKHGQAHHSTNAVVGLEGIMPVSPYDVNKRRKSTSADIERAQKFRERAKTVTMGKPEFRATKKYEGKDIYKTLGSHPDLLELTGAHVGGPRRVSDDRTSNCNSAPDEFFDALDQIESEKNSSDPGSTNNSARNSMVVTAASNNNASYASNLYENICNNLGPKFEKLISSGKSVEGIAYQVKEVPSTELTATTSEV